MIVGTKLLTFSVRSSPLVRGREFPYQRWRPQACRIAKSHVLDYSRREREVASTRRSGTMPRRHEDPRCRCECRGVGGNSGRQTLLAIFDDVFSSSSSSPSTAAEGFEGGWDVRNKSRQSPTWSTASGRKEDLHAWHPSDIKLMSRWLVSFTISCKAASILSNGLCRPLIPDGWQCFFAAWITLKQS